MNHSREFNFIKAWRALIKIEKKNNIIFICIRIKIQTNTSEERKKKLKSCFVRFIIIIIISFRCEKFVSTCYIIYND